MASGCILGECPLCGELIYEDEAGWDDDLELCHESCLKEKIIWRSVHDQFVLIAVRKGGRTGGRSQNTGRIHHTFS